MRRRSRRHSTGFGYIGFGNNQSTFNQTSKTPFSVYKEKLDLEAHLHYEMHFLHKDLSKEAKHRIREKIRNFLEIPAQFSNKIQLNSLANINSV